MGLPKTFDIESIRARSGILSAAAARKAMLESLKSINPISKPVGKTLNHRFSQESGQFSGSGFKKSTGQISKNEVIPLDVGRPAAEFYPWNFVMFQTTSVWPSKRDYHDENDANEHGPNAIVKRGGAYDLARGLNYGDTAGSPALLRFITEHVEMVHRPPYKNWRTCLSTGSTSAFEIALRIFCDRGDTILTERYTYPGFIEAANLVGVRALGIEMDAGGLLPDHLECVLRNWDESRGPRPSVLYTIPSGQNPTGSTQTFERKNAIYKVAEDYDLVIIEDDPYFYLRTDLDTANVEMSDAAARPHVAQISTYLESLPTSFLSLDRSGRVVRLDSTSKILAPGLRAGWITASDEIIDKFLSYHEVAGLAVSGPTQLMLWHLLEGTWGHLGFFSWLERLCARYCTRLKITLEACDSYLPKAICKWVRPQNGMFVWISIDLLKHPIFDSDPQIEQDALFMETQRRQIEANILSKSLKRGVKITPGSFFDANKTLTNLVCIRLTYAAAAESEISKGVEKVAEVIREEFAI